MTECIHGFEAGLCDVCFPKTPPPRPRAQRAPTPVRDAPVRAKPRSIDTGSQRVYHVTHIGNLESIIQAGGLVADARPPLDLSSELTRELRGSAEVTPGDPVSGYVPFYLDPEAEGWLQLRDGAEDPRWSSAARAAASTDFIFLISTLGALGEHVALADGDAAGTFTRFASGAELGRMLVRLHDAGTRPAAEALAKSSVPWEAVQLIGVANEKIRDRVRALTDTKVAVHPPWFTA